MGTRENASEVPALVFAKNNGPTADARWGANKRISCHKTRAFGNSHMRRAEKGPLSMNGEGVIVVIIHVQHNK